MKTMDTWLRTSMYFHCYLCDFETDIDKEWQDHVKEKHPSMPVYPSLYFLRKNNLKPQNKIWEGMEFE